MAHEEKEFFKMWNTHIVGDMGGYYSKRYLPWYCDQVSRINSTTDKKIKRYLPWYCDQVSTWLSSRMNNTIDKANKRYLPWYCDQVSEY